MDRKLTPENLAEEKRRNLIALNASKKSYKHAKEQKAFIENYELGLAMLQELQDIYKYGREHSGEWILYNAEPLLKSLNKPTFAQSERLNEIEDEFDLDYPKSCLDCVKFIQTHFDTKDAMVHLEFKHGPVSWQEKEEGEFESTYAKNWEVDEKMRKNCEYYRPSGHNKRWGGDEPQDYEWAQQEDDLYVARTFQSVDALWMHVKIVEEMVLKE